MAFTTLPTFVQDKAIDVDYLNQIKTNLDDHETRLAQVVGSIIPNGSFESAEAAAPYYANNWARTHYTGGTSGTQTTDPGDGARCLYITSPGGSGNGGGYYDSDYIYCPQTKQVNIAFMLRSSVVGIHNLVEVRWYDATKTYISSTTIYDDTTTNPTSWREFLRAATPPSGARFFKVRLTGAKNDDTAAGTCYFDAVRLSVIDEVKIPQFSVTFTGDTATWVDQFRLAVWVPTHASKLLVRVYCIQHSNVYQTGIRIRIGSTYYTVIDSTAEIVNTGAEADIRVDSYRGTWIPDMYVQTIERAQSATVKFVADGFFSA